MLSSPKRYTSKLKATVHRTFNRRKVTQLQLNSPCHNERGFTIPSRKNLILALQIVVPYKVNITIEIIIRSRLL